MNMSMEVTPLDEGGKEGNQRQMYVKTTYSDLVLTRGLFVGSGIFQWCQEAVQEKNIKPVNVIISLLDELHMPIMGWHVLNAYPIQLSLGEFDASQSSLVVETLTLHYEKFINLRI